MNSIKRERERLKGISLTHPQVANLHGLSNSAYSAGDNSSNLSLRTTKEKEVPKASSASTRNTVDSKKEIGLAKQMHTGLEMKRIAENGVAAETGAKLVRNRAPTEYGKKTLRPKREPVALLVTAAKKDALPFHSKKMRPRGKHLHASSGCKVRRTPKKVDLRAVALWYKNLKKPGDNEPKAEHHIRNALLRYSEETDPIGQQELEEHQKSKRKAKKEKKAKKRERKLTKRKAKKDANSPKKDCIEQINDAIPTSIPTDSNRNQEFEIVPIYRKRQASAIEMSVAQPVLGAGNKQDAESDSDSVEMSLDQLLMDEEKTEGEEEGSASDENDSDSVEISLEQLLMDEENTEGEEERPDASGESDGGSYSHGSFCTVEPILTLTVQAESDDNSSLEYGPRKIELSPQLPVTPAQRRIGRHFSSLSGFYGDEVDTFSLVGRSVNSSIGSHDYDSAAGMVSSGSPHHAQVTARYHYKLTADSKRARNKHILSAVLASNNPLSSRSWWCIKHPAVRLATAILVLLLNLFLYYGNPASFSLANAHGTFLGDTFQGWFASDDSSFWLAARLTLMVFLCFFGAYSGLRIQRYVLRDSFHLAMFGFDNGMDSQRNPLADQDGALFVVMCTVGLFWYGGLRGYDYYLRYLEVDESHRPSASMHNVSFAAYQLATAGVATYTRNWYMVVAVLDQMLQAVHRKEGTGYLAYVLDFSTAEDGNSNMLKISAWWMRHRIVATWLLLIIGLPPVVIAMVYSYEETMDVYSENSGPGRTVGDWAWSPSSNTEYTRMAVTTFVSVLNLLLLSQDWEFPDFSGNDIRIVGLNVSSITINIPSRVFAFFDSNFEQRNPQMYISNKHLTYLGTMLSVAFDWTVWFMAALYSRPCDYGLLWDQNTGAVYSIAGSGSSKILKEYAGASKAGDCSFFTNNPLQDLFSSGSEYTADDNDDNGQILIVRVNAGIFTAARDSGGQPPLRMWLICTPLVLAWFVAVWLVCKHERMNLLNRHKVLRWFTIHLHDPESEFFDPELGFGPSSLLPGSVDTQGNRLSPSEIRKKAHLNMMKVLAAREDTKIEAIEASEDATAVIAHQSRREKEPLPAHKQSADELFEELWKVKDSDYKGGEADVIRANLKTATLTWEQMAGEVIQSGDTIFGFDEELCASLFELLDSDGDGSLTVEEIMRSGEDPTVASFVHTSNQPILESLVCHDEIECRVTRLRREHLKRAFISTVDKDGDGTVSRVEWGHFIHQLRNERILYLKQYLLINRNAYFGKGMTAGEPYMDLCGLVSRGWLLRGWCEDFANYCKNNHPMLILFFTDPENPFTPYERRIDFFFTCAVTLLGAALLSVFGESTTEVVASKLPEWSHGVGYHLVQALFVSLPVMASRQVGYHLVGCPCLLADVSAQDDFGQRAYSTLQSVELFAANVMGVVAFAIILAALAIFIRNPVDADSTSHWWTVAMFFPQTWIYWLLQTLLIPFQPNFLCVRAITCERNFRWFHCGMIGIGQWMHERRLVIDTVRQRIEERGESKFTFAPGSSVGTGVELRSVACFRYELARRIEDRGLLPPKLKEHLFSTDFKERVQAVLGKQRVLPSDADLADIVRSIQQELLRHPGGARSIKGFATEGWVHAWLDCFNLRKAQKNGGEHRSASGEDIEKDDDEGDDDSDDSLEDEGDTGRLMAVSSVTQMIRSLICGNIVNIVCRLHGEVEGEGGNKGSGQRLSILSTSPFEHDDPQRSRDMLELVALQRRKQMGMVATSEEGARYKSLKRGLRSSSVESAEAASPNDLPGATDRGAQSVAVGSTRQALPSQTKRVNGGGSGEYTAPRESTEEKEEGNGENEELMSEWAVWFVHKWGSEDIEAGEGLVESAAQYAKRDLGYHSERQIGVNTKDGDAVDKEEESKEEPRYPLHKAIVATNSTADDDDGIANFHEALIPSNPEGIAVAKSETSTKNYETSEYEEHSQKLSNNDKNKTTSVIKNDNLSKNSLQQTTRQRVPKLSVFLRAGLLLSSANKKKQGYVASPPSSSSSADSDSSTSLSLSGLESESDDSDVELTNEVTDNKKNDKGEIRNSGDSVSKKADGTESIEKDTHLESALFVAVSHVESSTNLPEKDYDAAVKNISRPASAAAAVVERVESSASRPAAVKYENRPSQNSGPEGIRDNIGNDEVSNDENELKIVLEAIVFKGDGDEGSGDGSKLRNMIPLVMAVEKGKSGTIKRGSGVVFARKLAEARQADAQRQIWEFSICDQENKTLVSQEGITAGSTTNELKEKTCDQGVDKDRGTGSNGKEIGKIYPAVIGLGGTDDLDVVFRELCPQQRGRNEQKLTLSVAGGLAVHGAPIIVEYFKEDGGEKTASTQRWRLVNTKEDPLLLVASVVKAVKNVRWRMNLVDDLMAGGEVKKLTAAKRKKRLRSSLSSKASATKLFFYAEEEEDEEEEDVFWLALEASNYLVAGNVDAVIDEGDPLVLVDKSDPRAIKWRRAFPLG